MPRSKKETKNKKVQPARPFLKWAGGKSQLIPEIIRRMPVGVTESGIIERYVEPFIGGGALFFYLRNHFDIKKAYIMDINRELIMTLKTVKRCPRKLIKELRELKREFYAKENPEGRKELYYKIRERFNHQREDFDYDRYDQDWVSRSAMMIFLNKTCFNGLFRQNRRGGFNVPFGKYKNPVIFDEHNILEVYRALKKTDIIQGDFFESERYVREGTVVYLDPPYRPLNKTSSFTEYYRGGFTDDDQRRLFGFFKTVDEREAFVILSNSDPRNNDNNDHFFDDLYKRYNIQRVDASRTINCNGEGRGKIKELLVTNY